MIFWILPFLLFFQQLQQQSCAQTLYVHEVGVPPIQFFKTLESQNKMSLTEFVTKSAKILDLSLIKTPETASESLKIIRALEESGLKSLETEYLFNLYFRHYLQTKEAYDLKRLAAIARTNPALAAAYPEIASIIQVEVGDQISTISETEKNFLQTLLGKDESVLIVDGKIVASEEIVNLSQGPHHFGIFSNSFYPLIFVGPISEFEKSHAVRIPIVGNCQDKELLFPKNSLSQIQIVILRSRSSCLSMGLDLSKNLNSTSFDGEVGTYDSKWLMPAVGVVAGLFLIQGMKDKQMVIKFPALPF